jgi:DNA-binding transcriptional regulator YhcF (GntR family)
MSWQAARAALDIDMSPTCKFVYIVLALRAGQDRRAWPSVATIAADTGLGRSTVRRALGQLRKAGHIGVVHRQGRSSLVTVTPLAASTVPLSERDPTVLANDEKRARCGTQKYKEEKKEVAPAGPSDKRPAGAEVNGNGRVPHELLHDYEWVELADGTVERRWLHGQSS